MARRARLTIGVAVCAVLALHAIVLESIARQLDVSSELARVAPVLFTRTLRPAEPETQPSGGPKVQPVANRQRSAPIGQSLSPARPPASAAVAAPSADEGTPTVATDGTPRSIDAIDGVGNKEPPGLTESEAAKELPAAVVASPSPSQPQAVDTWPDATRLSYRLGGRFRSGDLYGSAQVAWQRDGADYQVRIDVDITLFASFSMVSQGTVLADRLSPRVFEEIRPGRKRRLVRFEETQVVLDNGTVVSKPPNVQDAASQFVQFTRDFSAGSIPTQVGQTVTVAMARPGGLDLWIYDVVALEEVKSPTLGLVPALHLRPRPIAQARGNITMEMWFAPTLKYLPIRIQLRMGDEALLDLVVEKVEQR